MASIQSLQNWLYMSYFLAAKAVPMAAVGSSLVFAVSPMHTVRTIQRAGSTMQFPFAPFFFFFIQSLIYTLYGYVTTNMLMGGSAALSAILGLHYVYVYCKHAANKTTPLRYLIISTSLVGLLGIHALQQPAEQSQLLIGIPGNILSLLTSASPLLRVKTIVKTQDATCLPLGMSVMTVVASGLWLLYGLILQDVLVIYPNMFSLTMGIIQVSLIAKYSYYNPRKASVATASSSGPAPTQKKKIMSKRKSFHEKV